MSDFVIHCVLTIKQESKSQTVFGPRKDEGSQGIQGRRQSLVPERVGSASHASPTGPLLCVLPDPWRCAHSSLLPCPPSPPPKSLKTWESEAMILCKVHENFTSLILGTKRDWLVTLWPKFKVL